MGPSVHLVSQEWHRAWDLGKKKKKEGKKEKQIRLVPPHLVTVSMSKLLSISAAASSVLALWSALIPSLLGCSSKSDAS